MNEFVINTLLSDLDSSIEEVKEHNKLVEISVLGGSSVENDIETVMQRLSKNGVPFVKAYIIGDEDPWCSLLWLEDNIVHYEELSGVIYENISECDESELDIYEDLREAKEKGPNLYFNDKFNSWKEGLEPCNLSAIKSEIESIINYSEF
ncbi:hypothetical protein [Pleionea sediminis]|uniref:hypothetical protein n=1 Tax=Pleionea sediminis TaxID=2569479 RepID=UPI001185B279|nr:hypothetical protein [Pleionea sediminis]